MSFFFQRQVFSRCLASCLTTLMVLTPASLASAGPETLSDAELYKNLQTRQLTLAEQQEQLITRQSALKSPDQYWGRYTDGGDAHWLSLWGFVFPGFAQLSYIFDDKAPAWLRWSGAAQWVSLGIVGFGGAQLVGQDQRSRMGMTVSASESQQTSAWLWGGLGAYTLLGLVPNAVVSVHDHVAQTEAEAGLKAVATDLSQTTAEYSRLDPFVKLMEAADNGNYRQALLLVADLSPAEALEQGIDAERIQSWKHKIFDAYYQKFVDDRKTDDVETQISQIENVLEHDLISSRPEVEVALKAELPGLREQAEREQRLRSAREAQEQRDSRRRDIYADAYALAKQGEYLDALTKLNEYNWQPDDPEYTTVQEKRKTWNMSWYTKMYKSSVEIASQGYVSEALSTLETLQWDWPKNHPDYKRMQQKIKDWTWIVAQQERHKVKHGFLNKTQMKMLKDMGYPIIVTSEFPSYNTWHYTVATNSTFNEYRITYYDHETHKSFAIVGGYLCGRLSSSLFRSVQSQAKEFVNNPVLGKVGLLSLSYADAYLTTNLNQRSGNCYTLVTPANLESWMTDYGDDVPSDAKRLTKAEFIEVIKALKYLP